MSRRTNYTRAEIERVTRYLAELDKKYVDVSSGYIRDLAGESEGDYNMYLMVTELERSKLAARLECSEWLHGKGYQKVDGFWLTDSFYRENIGRPIEKNNQIAMFNHNQL